MLAHLGNKLYTCSSSTHEGGFAPLGKADIILFHAFVYWCVFTNAAYTKPKMHFCLLGNRHLELFTNAP